MSVHSISYLQLNMLTRILKDYRGITTRLKFPLKASHTERAATPRSINNVALLIKGVLFIYTGKNLTDISLNKYYTTSFISFLRSFVGQLHLLQLRGLFSCMWPFWRRRLGCVMLCQSHELSVQCQFSSSVVINNNYVILTAYKSMQWSLYLQWRLIWAYCILNCLFAMCVFPSQYGGSDWTGTVIILTHEPCFYWRQESALIQKLLLEYLFKFA